MKKIRWGISGPGMIAQKFADAIERVEDAELCAVASRTEGKAAEFAKKFDVPKVYSSYEEMAADKDIDAVYISTAHPFHHTAAEVFIKAKKHVLCEKPMCTEASAAKKLMKLAEENGVFLMEAMWTAFFPAVKALKSEVDNGVIGTPMGLTADFCYSIEPEEDPKLFEKDLCGGSLLDVGVYCLYFSALILGRPTDFSAVSNIQNGVDVHTQMLLKYENGAIAGLSSAIKLEKPYDAYIYGTKGRIYIPDFYKADRYVITLSDGTVTEKNYPYGDNGFVFEIKEACRCIAAGETQSGIYPLSETLETLKLADKIKSLTGLEF